MKNPIILEKIRLAKLGKPSNKKGYKCTKKQIENMKLAHKNQIPWNKGLKDLPKQSKECIQKRSEKMIGHLNPSWKGNNAGYGGVHNWIRKTYGKANCCDNKNCSKKSMIYEWANINFQYKRNIEDYIKLCRSCHRKFDKGSLLLEEIKDNR